MILFAVNYILSYTLNKGKRESEENLFYYPQEDRDGKLSENEI